MKKILAMSMAFIIACGLLLTGCDKDNKEHNGGVSEQEIAQNGIQMENYLTLYTRGKDGHARLYADIDFIALKKDCAKFLVDDVSDIPKYVSQRYQAETVEEYLEYIFKYVETYDLVESDKYEKLSNGDIVNITVGLPDRLEYILSVPAAEATIQYTIKGLEKFEGIDPFEYTNFSYLELVSVDGTVGYELYPSAKPLIIRPDGTYETIFCDLDLEDGKISMPGDTFHLSLDESDVSRYVKEYGENVFTRTEADVKLERIGYLPTGDNAADVFKYMDEECLDNVDYAAKDLMDEVTKSETSVERIGMMFFYDDEGVLERRDSSYKFYNQIVFIYKVTNGSHPEGWYSYMAYNAYVTISWRLDFGTLEYEKCVGNIYGFSLNDNYLYYRNEHPQIFRGEFPLTFEYEGCEYPGHLDLSDVFTAIKTNLYSVGEYDHLIVTDELKDFVDVY